jgi:hypothetical protein
VLGASPAGALGEFSAAGRAELDCTTIERSIWQLALNRQCDFRSCSIIATRAEVVSAPSVAAGHIGRGLSHVDENEAFGLQVEWSVETRPRTGAGCRADSARSSPSPNLTCNAASLKKPSHGPDLEMPAMLSEERLELCQRDVAALGHHRCSRVSINICFRRALSAAGLACTVTAVHEGLLRSRYSLAAETA